MLPASLEEWVAVPVAPALVMEVEAAASVLAVEEAVELPVRS